MANRISVGDLVAKARAKGIAIATDGATLKLEGKGMDPYLESQITSRKDEVMAHIKGLSVMPSIMSASALLAANPPEHEPIIAGILRRGETMNVISSPKIGKSWLSLGLAFSVCSGQDWLGCETTAGRPIIFDCELQPATFAKRLKTVAEAMECDMNAIDVVTLRGTGVDLNGLRHYIKTHVVPGAYHLIILDALYRLIPQGISENHNAEMMSLYITLDAIAAHSQAAVVVIHHSSKEDQGGKEVTDVSSGAGAISRAADSHLVIRPHEIATCANRRLTTLRCSPHFLAESCI